MVDQSRSIVTRNFPITLPHGSVDGIGDAIVPGLTSLPEPPVQQVDDTAATYGLRVFAYLIRHEITATLSDSDLEIALHASIYATSARDVLPVTIATVNKIRHLISTILVARRREVTTEVPSAQCYPVDKPNEGPMARLQPIVPGLPPIGQVVKPEIRF